MEIIPKAIILQEKKKDIISSIKFLNDYGFKDVEICTQTWISKVDISNFKNLGYNYSVSIKKCDTLLDNLQTFIKLIK